MSKVAIKGAASGTATFTIESPATNTDRTLVLPDVAGTVALTSQIPAAPTIASTGEAQAGTNNTNVMTPLRSAEQRNATALGSGQTWTDVTSSRSSGVTYTNTTGRPIFVVASSQVNGAAPTNRLSLTVSGIEVGFIGTASNIFHAGQLCAVVPNNGTYVFTFSGTLVNRLFAELR